MFYLELVLAVPYSGISATELYAEAQFLNLTEVCFCVVHC